MDPMLLLIAVACAGSIALATIYAFERWSGPRNSMRARLASAPRQALAPAGVLRQHRALPFIERLPISAEGREQTQLDLDRAGLRWRVQEYLGLRLGLALGFALIASLLLGAAGLPLILSIVVALLAMVGGWLAPRHYLNRRRRKRMIEVESQLPDALTVIAKSLRAGTGLLQALGFAADETPAPLGPELGSALRDLQLGAEPVQVFRSLAARVGSPDLDIAVTAIIIQRTVGGSLAEILSNVTGTIRERVKIQREVRVLVTRQMLQANLTAGLPVVICLLFIAISPDIGRALINTTAGNIALGFAAFMEIAGLYVVRRMAVIEV